MRPLKEDSSIRRSRFLCLLVELCLIVELELGLKLGHECSKFHSLALVFDI